MLDRFVAPPAGARRAPGGRPPARDPAGPTLTGRLMVLSGPSGVGKSSVVDYLRTNHPAIDFSVSVTTRAPRPGEIDGVHYHFIDRAEFERMIAGGELLEWAEFAGNLYGTPAAPVRESLAAGRPVIVEIELQGARQVRSSAPDALQVFLSPPSWVVLVDRLRGRATEAPADIARRLETARVELAAEGEFDVSVVNDSVPLAAEEIVGLLTG
ncbi:MAG: guanylate kinase [Actinomycetota bacterium]